MSPGVSRPRSRRGSRGGLAEAPGLRNWRGSKAGTITGILHAAVRRAARRSTRVLGNRVKLDRLSSEADVVEEVYRDGSPPLLGRALAGKIEIHHLIELGRAQSGMELQWTPKGDLENVKAKGAVVGLGQIQHVDGKHGVGVPKPSPIQVRDLPLLPTYGSKG